MDARPTLVSIAGRIPKRIVIAGSGESAWLAAALLSRAAGRLGCRITVVGNADPITEFPGEATQPSIHRLLSNLGVDEHDLLRACRGTYRLATQFSDWVQADRDFWMPLSSDTQRSLPPLFNAWHSERRHGRLLRPLHSYSLHWSAALGGKAPGGFAGPSPITRSGAYAFHVDGQLLSRWLRDQALKSGVEHVVGSVAQALPNGRGGIAQLRLSDGQVVAGDFFINAGGLNTGGVGTGAGSATSDGRMSWKDDLPGDQVTLMSIPGRRQIPPFTRITALRDGWTWQMPLADTIVCGCVTDSETTDAEGAAQLLREHCFAPERTSSDRSDMSDPPENANGVHILSLGRQRNFWIDNTLAIGSVACQPGPLLSAGLHLAQLQTELFIDLFPERLAHSASVELFNSRISAIADDLRDFTRLHFEISQRSDSEFWKTARQSTLSEPLCQRLKLFDATALVEDLLPEGICAADYWHLLAGGGRLPTFAAAELLAIEPAAVQDMLRTILKSNEAALKDLPLHEELLDWIHAAQPELPGASDSLPLRSAS